MNKRIILIILIVILILGIVGGLLYFAYKKQNQAKAPVVVQTQPQIKKLVDDRVISPIPSFDNNAIWYFNADGRLFRINTDGSGVSEFPLPALGNTLISALWAKSGSDFLAFSASGGGRFKSFYNSTQKIYINLPSNMQYMDWLPDGKRIAYIWKSSDNLHQYLATADADGTGFKKISDVLFWPDLVVKVSPDGKTILLYRPVPEGNINKIYSADVATGAISTIIDTGKNIGAAWLPIGNKFVFTQNNGTAYPKLFLYDFATKAAIDLKLNTNVEKILVDKDSRFLYAAVPRKDNTGDDFIKLDLNTFSQEIYFTPSQSVRANNLMLLGNSLYFVNTLDGKLYTIIK